MTDFTQRVTEDDMTHVRSIFERAANAIVAQSELGQRLAALQAEFDAFKINSEAQIRRLQAQVDGVSETNRYLTEQLSIARNERNEARVALSDLQTSHNESQSQLANLGGTLTQRDAEIQRLRDQVHGLERERDEWQLKAMAAEEELASLKSKLEDAEAWFDGVRSMLHPPQPEPEPEPAPVQAQEETVPTWTPEVVPSSPPPSESPSPGTSDHGGQTDGSPDEPTWKVG